ncbi:hypothetical protein MRX96_042223 [Rhipicephalus microplus]
MVRSGGISIVGALTGVSCVPSSASSTPVSSSRSEREGDEKERDLADEGRRSTVVPAAGTLFSSTGSLADASPPESSVPGTSVSSADIHEEALEADDVERDRYNDEKTSRALTKSRLSWTGDQDLVARTMAFRELKATA